jgi:hypothetical protein
MAENSDLKIECQSWVWLHVPVIPAIGRLRQEDQEFKDSLGYIVRPYLKTKPERPVAQQEEIR